MPKEKEFISLLEASQLCSYSQEYISLLARRGKLFARKIGRNWYTTRAAIQEYIAQQNVTISLPRAVLQRMPALQGTLASADVPEAFEPARPSPVMPPRQLPMQDDKVLQKLDSLSGSLTLFAQQVKEATHDALSRDVVDTVSRSWWYRITHLNRNAKYIFQNPQAVTAMIVTAIVALFILIGGFAFGNVGAVAQQIRDVFKNAETLQGYFPGTHANEVLLLDKSGKISIFGHIETQGQFRSYVPDGVAPIVVDSTTKIENLNADYLDDLSAGDFTLAFVTKNGNVTYEDVKLEGNVEVGKTLRVKGAARLLDSLQVHGKLGVFSDAVFSKEVTLTGGNLNIQQGNLKLGAGTIELNNTTMIRNLNAEFFQDRRPQDFTLDFVIANNNSTNRLAFFNGGLYGGDGAFATLGVAGDTSIGSSDKRDKVGFTVFSKNFTIDSSGNVSTPGAISGNALSVGLVDSDLIPSGSFDLGSPGSPWQALYVESASFTGTIDLGGTASSSFRINTDNISSDSEDAYLSFERGTTTPNAMLKWNAADNRFEFNGPVFISSSSATTFSVSGGPASLSNTLYVENSGNVGIGTAAPLTRLEVQGTASASRGVFGNELNVALGNVATVSYSRFGTDTAGHSLSAASDLLISGLLEVNSAAYFDSFASVASNFEVVGYASASKRFGSGLADCDNTTTSKLLWSDTGLFSCGTDQTGGGGSSFSGIELINSGEAFGTHYGSLSFDAGHFTLSTGSPEASASYLRLDWGDGGPASLSQNETVTGIWNFSNGASVATSLELTSGYASISNTLFVDTGTDGRVGIGTTAPQTTLEINKSQNNTTALLIFNNDPGASAMSRVEVQADVDLSLIAFGTNTVNPGVVALHTDDAYNELRISAVANIPLTFRNNSLERMRIAPGGRVGIGTASPDYLLELASASTAFTLRSTGATSSASINFYPAGGASTSNQAAWTIRAGGSGGAGERLDILGGTSATPLLTIASTGNVGIGTTSPAVKLQVAGSASVSSNFEVVGYASASQYFSGGLTDCDDLSQFLQWTASGSSAGKFSCSSSGVSLTAYTASGSQTWTKPEGTTLVQVVLYGGGGSGGGGVGAVAGNGRTGGAGGGGGAYVTKVLRASDLEANVSVTIGGGGTGAAGGAAGAGSDGSAGTRSTFGTHASASAGGGGAGVAAGTNAAGGGGGGSCGVGDSSIDATVTTGGCPSTLPGEPGIAGQGAGGEAGLTAGNNAEYGGGGGGGGRPGGTGGAGGSSLFGGGAGGGGGAVTAANAQSAGADGGDTGNYVAGGGGAGGAAGGTAGTAGADGGGTKGGSGGGGGGGNSAGTGGASGHGGVCGGGSGGGGGGTSTGGASANGGDGCVFIFSVLGNSDSSGATGNGWADDGTVVRLTTSTDSVGIGTVSPGARLDVYGDSTGHVLVGGLSDATNYGAIGFNSTLTATNYTLSGLAGGETLLNGQINQPIKFRIANNTKMILNPSGRFGIGTESPDYLLELASASTAFTLRSTGSTSSVSINFYPAGGASSSNQAAFTIMAAGAGPADESLHFINGAGSKVVTIASTGFVGIGVTTPSVVGAGTRTQMLEVAQSGINDPLAVFRGIGTTSAPSIIVNNAAGSFTIGIAGSADNYVLGTDQADAGIRITGDLLFGDSDTTLFTIASSGNVGIGTSTPSASLEVLNPETQGSATALRLKSNDSALAQNQELRLDFFTNLQGTDAARIAGRYFNPDYGLAFYGYAGALNADPTLTIRGTGKIGVGTTAPKGPFMIVDANPGATSSGSFAIRSSNTIGSVVSISATALTTGSALEITLPASPSVKIGGAILVQNTSGTVLASMSNNGRLALHNSIFSRGAVSNCTGTNTPTSGCIDYAESYPTADVTLSPGEVVMSDGQGIGVSRASASGVVLGVVSTNPASLIDDNSFKTGAEAKASEGTVPIALAGRVPVRTSLENGAIRVGDHLTVSATRPGYAMKATQAGQTIGIALEPLTAMASGSEPMVMTFVNTSYWAPSTGALAQTASASGVVVTNGSSVDFLGALANAAEVVVRKLKVTGDIIAQGITKTYYSVAELFPNYDLETMVLSWADREVSIESTVTDEQASLFRGTDAKAADQSKVDLEENGSYLATYGVDSTRGEVQLSGTSDLVAGEAKIFFDFSFTAIISGQVPLRILLTPVTNTVTGQLYVATKTPYGFIVKELNGSSTGKFDWLVIARRKGYDADAVPSPSPSPTGPPSPSLSPTPSSIPSPTPTPTESPALPTSEVGTPTDSVGASPSPSPEPTLSPSESPTPELTPTPSESPSPSPTPEPTPSPTPTPTPSDSPTPTPMPSESPSPTPSPTPEPTPSPTPTP